jgi:hypothetical protein
MPTLDDLYGPGASDAACADQFPLYAEGDKCPECGKPMLYDAGEPMTREHLGSSPCIYCDYCGCEYPVDYDRMAAAN